MIKTQDAVIAAHKFSNTVTRALLTCFQHSAVTTKVSRRNNKEHAQPMMETYWRYG